MSAVGQRDGISKRRILVVLLLAVSPACAADQFRLEVPGDDGIHSTAVLEPDHLTITTNGTVHVYTAQPRFDSADGSYRAFYNQQARQFVRWPVRGAGSMFIGTASGGQVSWRASLMQVVPLRGPIAGPHAVQRPEISTGPRERFFPDVGDRTGRFGAHQEAASPSLAVLRDGRGEISAAIVDDQGRLHEYSHQGRWQPRPQRVGIRLVPRAPLVLANDRSRALPTVYTVSQDGALIAIADGRITKLAAGRAAPSFVPGTHLATIHRGGYSKVFAVDKLGRIWEFDTERLQFEAIESRAGFFQPGAPITAMAASEDRVYLVDLRGNLVEYHLRVGGWSRPALVADGFPPSCPTAAGFLAMDTLPGTYLSAIDAQGKLRLLRETNSGWQTDVVDGVRMPPLSPIDLAVVGGRLSLCGVDGLGRWNQWFRDGGRWRKRTIAAGFLPGTPVALVSQAAVSLAVDPSQRLIAGQLLDDQWECRVCTPAADFAARLLSRQVIANPPLEPVTVELVNSHHEPLIVRVYDVTNAGSPNEVRVPAGNSVSLRVERDAGATLEEVYLEDDGLGRRQQRIQRLPLPPRSLYTVVVNVERVTSVYFDRTRNKGPVPDKVSTSAVSLGTFRLPAGAALIQGAQIDVARQAQAQRNPGAGSLIEATTPP